MGQDHFYFRDTYLTNAGCTHSQAGEAVIKESVEPILEEYRPSGITSLKFSKFSLGTVAPKIEGNILIVLFFCPSTVMNAATSILRFCGYDM